MCEIFFSFFLFFFFSSFLSLECAGEFSFVIRKNHFFKQAEGVLENLFLFVNKLKICWKMYPCL